MLINFNHDTKHMDHVAFGQQSFSFFFFFSGKWMLVDKSLNLRMVNRFDVSQVFKCIIHWDCGTVNLELWSKERPVSKESPLKIEHEYEVTSFP
jgi:alpha-glucosidase